MINVFGSNYSEVGSLKENLVLSTAGKIKIRIGNKFIDILDNNGNLNVLVPKLIVKINSLDEIKLNGFYLLEKSLYLKYDNEIIQITNDSLGFLEYDNKLILTEEQTKIVKNNIGLYFDNIKNIPIKNGIFFTDDDIYKIKSGNVTQFLLEPLNSINNINTSPNQSNSTIVWTNQGWKYLPIVTLETFNKLEKKVNYNYNNSSNNDNIPVGCIIMWYGNSENVPEGWVICDGENGTPDLRDRFVIGAGNTYNNGDIGGESEVTLEIENIPEHSHNINDIKILSSLDGTFSFTEGTNGELNNVTTDFVGEGKPHNNIPPYYALYYIMKIKVLNSDEELLESDEELLEEENN